MGPSEQRVTAHPVNGRAGSRGSDATWEPVQPRRRGSWWHGHGVDATLVAYGYHPRRRGVAGRCAFSWPSLEFWSAVPAVHSISSRSSSSSSAFDALATIDTGQQDRHPRQGKLVILNAGAPPPPGRHRSSRRFSRHLHRK